MKNETFEVGQRFRCDVNGVILEVVDIGTDIDGKMRVHFKDLKSDRKSIVGLRHAQELLITKI